MLGRAHACVEFEDFAMRRVSLQTEPSSRAAKKSKSSCVDPPRVNDVLQYWLSASPSAKSKQRYAQDAVEIGVLQYCTDGSVYSSRLDAGNIETIGTVISVYLKNFFVEI